MEVSLGIIAFWGLVGWCGTPPQPFPFPQPPSPFPWFNLKNIASGLIGGIGGGLALHYGVDGASLAASAIAAYAGGRLISAISHTLIK